MKVISLTIDSQSSAILRYLSAEPNRTSAILKMHIERIQIEEGFLDGLDLGLVPGLNVIIGERGTGKTSLIELIRFCLDVPGYTPDSGRRSREHALSVLGSGQITVTIRNGEQAFTVTRQASGQFAKNIRSLPAPIIFSQTEIESVGLQPNGRLHLIDEFIPHLSRSETEEQIAVSEARSLMSEANAARRELEELEKQVTELSAVEQQLLSLAPAETKLTKVSVEAAQKKKQADALSKQISSMSVAGSAVGRFLEAIQKWHTSVTATVRSSPRLEPWPDGGGQKDPLESTRERITKTQSHLRAALNEIAEAIDEAKAAAETITANKLPLEEQARKLRREVEALQSGAGATVRELSELREKKAQLESLSAVVEQRRKTLSSLINRRNRALDGVEQARGKKSKHREQAAARLNSVLGPRIRISVMHAAQHESFSAAIADILRGSGLRYSELAPSLAKAVSPRELLEAAESNDYELLGRAASISKDRSARVLAQIRETGMIDLVAMAVDDDVSLHLLDGQDYKEIAELSTGQRCTVVLPLVLSHTDRALIVDQPEDHIDNAFIVETVIRALHARAETTQTIFSTHNANIPVLGGADKVIQLGSDGHRGFVLAEGALEDQAIVASISTVMEGGAEAFKRRALFYSKHGSQ